MSVNLSPVGGAAAQFFDDNGNPLSGGKLYTYAAGTTTPLASYTTLAGNVAHTNPIIFDAAGRVPSGEIWLTQGLEYKFALYNSVNVLIATFDNIPAINDQTALTAYENLIASSSGASFVGYLPAGTGAVATTVQKKLRETVSVDDFYTVGDSDHSISWNKAILSLALKGGGKLITPSSAYTLLTKILVPKNIEIDLCKTVITGAGIGVGTIFETAFLSNGVLVTNIGTPDESNLIENVFIHDGTIQYCYRAFNVFNFIDGCEVKNMKFVDCTNAVYASRSFYSRWINLFSRGNANGTSEAAYTYVGFVNVEALESIFVQGRTLGFTFSGGINGLSIRNCSAESVTTGMNFAASQYPIHIDTCYFEGISGVAINMLGGGATIASTIDNCWFYACGTGIAGDEMINGRIGAGNYFEECGTNVNISDVTSTITVELPVSRLIDSSSLLPSLPAKYLLGAGVVAVQSTQIYNDSSGATVAKQSYSTLAPLPYSGKQSLVAGKVPFCNHAKTAGTTFNVVITTGIVFDDFVAVIFSVAIGDNNSVYRIAGRVYAETVILDIAAGRTVTSANVGGFLQLTLGQFSHPTEFYSCEGVVRHV